MAFLFFIFIIIICLSGSVANEEVGLPLRIFGRGNLCHPYLSLSYIDALSQPCVRGYMIGKFRFNNRKWRFNAPYFNKIDEVTYAIYDITAPIGQ